MGEGREGGLGDIDDLFGGKLDVALVMCHSTCV